MRSARLLVSAESLSAVLKLKVGETKSPDEDEEDDREDDDVGDEEHEARRQVKSRSENEVDHQCLKEGR